LVEPRCRPFSSPSGLRFPSTMRSSHAAAGTQRCTPTLRQVVQPPRR
jgi:hypothetical protein